MLGFLLFTSFLILSSAFPDGAPEVGCYTSRPLHENYMPIHNNISFVLEVALSGKNSEYYVNGEPLKLTLRSLYPETVKLSGYLITMTSSSGLTGGAFQTLAPDSKSIPDCGVTQTEKSTNRTEVSLLYTPPSDLILDTIQFRAIAVHNLSVFWDSVLSRPLSMKPDASLSEIQMIIDQIAQMANQYDYSNFGNILANPPTPATVAPTPSPPPPRKNRKPKAKARSRPKAV